MFKYISQGLSLSTLITGLKDQLMKRLQMEPDKADKVYSALMQGEVISAKKAKQEEALSRALMKFVPKYTAYTNSLVSSLLEDLVAVLQP